MAEHKSAVSAESMQRDNTRDLIMVVDLVMVQDVRLLLHYLCVGLGNTSRAIKTTFIPERLLGTDGARHISCRQCLQIMYFPEAVLAAVAVAAIEPPGRAHVR